MCEELTDFDPISAGTVQQFSSSGIDIVKPLGKFNLTDRRNAGFVTLTKQT